MPKKCEHITVQYCCSGATCSVALPCHVGTCDSSKEAITISPVERILIPCCRLDLKTGLLQGSLKGEGNNSKMGLLEGEYLSIDDNFLMLTIVKSTA